VESLTYKLASEQSEFEQIHQLNYLTFVEEIPQHSRNGENELIDKFHQENTYMIAKKGEEVVGMIAIRAKRPFSLDYKLKSLDDYLPVKGTPCEVRLLSIKKAYRSSRVFYHLCERLVQFCLDKGYTMALISGTVRQLKLYRRIGFIPFGPLTGEDGAHFQPMYLTKENFERSTKAFIRLMAKNKEPAKRISLLPGPVSIHPQAEKAFKEAAISHRSEEFKRELLNLRSSLCQMTGAAHAEVAVGTGTLSNDLVAAQLSCLPGRGLILANGEFGYRLIDHAKRQGLSFQSIEKEWNEPIGLGEIEQAVIKNPSISWIWTVHCETSTGYLYDLKSLKEICSQHHVELCVDACSSAGVVPLELKDIFLASAVSGKGFGSYPGLAIVFHREKLQAGDHIPRYLDLKMYQDLESIPYTHSSNLVKAMNQACRLADYEKTSRIAACARERMQEKGWNVLGDDSYSPGILTIKVPDGVSSREIGDACKRKGVLISYESEYLLKRNWIQAAFMGAISEQEAVQALGILEQAFEEHSEKRYQYGTV
jgi:aspartate aminotransferase-like enzyme